MANRLTIYFTSDTHGYLFPTDYAAAQPKPMGLLGEIAQFRKDENTLILDGGDTLQGSPLSYYYHLRGLPCPAARALNLGKYDFVTLGNHDFNYGPQALKAYLCALDARCLCANVAAEALPIAPCAVKTMGNGLRVGIVGIVTDWVNRWEKPANLEGIRVTEPLEAARAALESMRGKVDFTIGIYHGGYEKDLQTGRLLSDTDENIACRICEELDFDLLLTGHQHLKLENAVWHGTHLAQTPANGTHFIRVDVHENGAIESSLHPAIITDTPGFEKEEAEVNAWLDSPVGCLNRPLWPEDKIQMALHGTPIADFFNQVQLEATGADISCTSLANDVRGFAQQVTVRDVVATYVYPNTLVVLEVDKSVLRAALERCAAYFNEDLTVARDFLEPKVAHYNYDFFAGIEYTFDLAKPVGHRVVSLTRGGKPLAGKYTLVMNNYRATGVGGYDAYCACPHVREVLTEMSELILDYFEKHKQVTVQPLSAFRVIRSGPEGEKIL